MRTAEVIYNQIRWDPNLDEGRFVMGIEVRRAVPAEVRVVDFVPGGEIPWHRVLYFAADGETVWDRRERIDRLGTSEAGRVRATRVLAAPFFAPRPVFRFDAAQHAWVEAELASPTGEARALRVVSWNVLFDRYDRELIHTAQRHPRLFAALAEADADIIALQEMEPRSWAALLAEPWVRSAYVVSDEPLGARLDPYGVVLLSRRPVLEHAWHRFSDHKEVVAFVVDGPLVVGTVHLTSNKDAESTARRRGELVGLGRGVRDVAVPAVVVGDFNDTSAAPKARLAMVDAWEQLQGDDAPTFDPPNNALAAITSRKASAARYDRLLARDVRVDDIVRLGTQPVDDGLFLSDHYGLSATLAPLPRHGDTPGVRRAS